MREHDRLIGSVPLKVETHIAAINRERGSDRIITAVVWHLITEISEVMKQRNVVNYEDAVQIAREQEAKWKEICDKVTGIVLDPCGFRVSFEAGLPTLYAPLVSHGF